MKWRNLKRNKNNYDKGKYDNKRKPSKIWADTREGSTKHDSTNTQIYKWENSIEQDGMILNKRINEY